jgi:hypothetical protein
MSQSDYIQYKKTSTQLRLYDETPVLQNGNYISYKEHALENTIPTTKIIYNQLLPPTRSLIMGMEMASRENCPQFPVCENTHLRANRVPMLSTQATVRPARPVYVKRGDADLKKKKKCCPPVELPT